MKPADDDDGETLDQSPEHDYGDDTKPFLPAAGEEEDEDEEDDSDAEAHDVSSAARCRGDSATEAATTSKFPWGRRGAPPRPDWATAAPLPEELRGLCAAESILRNVANGVVPETSRFLRLVSRIGTSLCGARNEGTAKVAERRLFAVPLWMHALRTATGAPIWCSRGYCAIVVIFHRCGATAAAFCAYDALKSGGFQVPVCTLALLIDLCLKDAMPERIPQLLEEARTNAEEQLSRLSSSSPSASDSPCSMVPALVVEGMPSWVSSREGHLVSLVAAHAAALGGFSLPLLRPLATWPADRWPGLTASAADSATCGSTGTARTIARALSYLECSSPAEAVAIVLKEGLTLLDAAVKSGLAGPTEGLDARLECARALLLRPYALLSQEGFWTIPTQHEQFLGAAEGPGCLENLLDRTQKFTLDEDAAFPSPADIGDALGPLLGLVREFRESHRRLQRADLEDLMRQLGKRRDANQTLIYLAFESSVVLAVFGSRPLEERLRAGRAERRGLRETLPQDDEAGDYTAPSVSSTSDAREVDGSGAISPHKWLDEPPNPHLVPDADFYAAVIEALLAVGAADSAHQLFFRCRNEILPNPCIFSAVIFGCLGVRDGAAAANALLAMDKAGFLPHVRFLRRCLRLMGPHHSQGLRVIHSLVRGSVAERQILYHVLIEACVSAPRPYEDALEVLAALRDDGLETNGDTDFALLRACTGLVDEERALSCCAKMQCAGQLSPHPAFESLLCECFMYRDIGKRSGPIMESRRRWVRSLINSSSPTELGELTCCCNRLRVSADLGAEMDPNRPWLLATYCSTLPPELAAKPGAQYLAWRYLSVRSAVERTALQSLLNARFCEEPTLWDGYSFVLHVILHLHVLELPDSVQIRVLRMLFVAAEHSSAAVWRETHRDIIELRAWEISPDVLTELMHRCPKGQAAVFASDEARQRLADMVRHRYFGKSSRGRGGRVETVKLCTALRFVRAHRLADLLDDEVLMRPVLKAFSEGFVHHAFTLGETCKALQCRLVGCALRYNFRRQAGRLADRFGLSSADEPMEAPPGWELNEFRLECIACVREAELAEEQELRTSVAVRLAAEQCDEGCLRFPPAIEEQGVLLVQSEADLEVASRRFSQSVKKKAQRVDLPSDQQARVDFMPCGIFFNPRDSVAALGLDVEWRPYVEKRGGMQKHRRNGYRILEPCATLQVASHDFVAVFDLLELAPEGAPAMAAFARCIGELLSDPGILKLGFGLRNDLQRLAASYPHLPCFRRIRSTFDLQEGWLSEEGSSGSGLSALCSRHLGAPLSKRLQTSDWGARPLTREQVVYAALDAFCLLGLSRALPATELPRPLQDLLVQPSPDGRLHVYSVPTTLEGVEVSPNLVRDEDVGRETQKLNGLISAKGSAIRVLKASGAQPKSIIQAEVAELLQLKARYRELSGAEWVPVVASCS